MVWREGTVTGEALRFLGREPAYLRYFIIGCTYFGDVYVQNELQ